MSIVWRLLAVSLICSSEMSLACSIPESTPFREHLAAASSIFIFRLESAELRRENLGSEIILERIDGRIRVVETLKGSRPLFKAITIDTSCSDIRLDVGDYFIIATTQSGNVLSISPADRSVLDISSGYSETLPARSSDSIAVRAVIDYIAGKPLPADFPTGQYSFMTLKHIIPPPCTPSK